MQNVAEIFAIWPTDADLGRDIGLAYPTVAAWKQRGSIPTAYWRDIIGAARRRGHPEINADLLVRLHARKSHDAAPTGFAEDEAPTIEPPEETLKSGAQVSAGQFSRWKHLRRAHFASQQEIVAHIRALREEWDRR